MTNIQTINDGYRPFDVEVHPAISRVRAFLWNRYMQPENRDVRQARYDAYLWYCELTECGPDWIPTEKS